MAIDFIKFLKKNLLNNAYILYIIDYFFRFSFTFIYFTANVSDVIITFIIIFEIFATSAFIYYNYN